MRIALATCSNVPDWEVDDAHLIDALKQRHVSVDRPAWDDASYDWSKCDACLIRTTWDYAERREEFVAWADRVGHQTRLFNSADVVRWNTYKTYLRDLEDRGASVIPTVWLAAGSAVDVRRILIDRGWDRAFIKPVVGATARETLRFTNNDDGIAKARNHLERTLSHEPMMLQPYLDGVETVGELSVILIDNTVTHAVRKIPVRGDYRVQDDFGARDHPETIEPAVAQQARDIVRLVGADLLYARVDFLQDTGRRLYLTELELVEPLLFFRHCPEAAKRLADVLCERVDASR